MRELKQFFRGFKRGLRNFGYNIALIINSILLSLVYLVGVGLTSIIAKIFGKHFLDMKLSKKKSGSAEEVFKVLTSSDVELLEPLKTQTYSYPPSIQIPLGIVLLSSCKFYFSKQEPG